MEGPTFMPKSPDGHLVKQHPHGLASMKPEHFCPGYPAQFFELFKEAYLLQ